MICNKCANTRCRKDVDGLLVKCAQHVPIKGGWTMYELASANCPQELEAILTKFGLKITNKYVKRS